MLKIAFADVNKYVKYFQTPLLGKFVVLRLPSVPGLSEPELSQHLTNILVTDSVYKTTRAGRFSDLDEITVELLNRKQNHVIHDTAVSSGVTSIELYNCLSSAGLNFSFFVSDKYSEFTISGKSVCRVHDMDGKFVEGYVFSILANPQLSAKVFISKLLGIFLQKIPVSQDASTFYLYDAKLLDMIISGAVEHLRYDLLSGNTLSTQFTFVRCMNVLNRGNFSDEEIRNALSHLVSSLDEGGILLVGRTELDTLQNRASFFVKEKGIMRVCRETGGGSEIKDLIN